MKQASSEVVVFGATSFVGQILSRYLLARHGAAGPLRWAIAGRSRQKLEKLRTDLGPGAEKLPMIVMDAADEGAIRTMCDSTRVVASTVGPYALFGSPLVKVCAESGTDYCDLTGELPWIRRMIDAHEETARKSGARMVHCCGFDSMPSDLGVHFLQRHARARFGKPCVRIRLGVRRLRGGLSGGTAASLLNLVKESVRDRAVRKVMADPYAIAPRRNGGVRQPNVMFASYDREARTWLAPFVMGGINTRVVHRTNALTDASYGEDFVYDEATMTGPGVRGAVGALAMGLGLAAFVSMLTIPPTRWLVGKYVVPQPGEGPSPADQEGGSFDLRLAGTTADGDRLVVKVTGDRDPGYGSTGKMMGEAAACLALDVGDKPGGFWTPATIFGDRLIERLTQHAGLTFDVLGEG
jgi:short subunit dehydrogenase-like uncharacterized protein